MGLVMQRQSDCPEQDLGENSRVGSLRLRSHGKSLVLEELTSFKQVKYSVEVQRKYDDCIQTPTLLLTTFVTVVKLLNLCASVSSSVKRR